MKDVLLLVGRTHTRDIAQFHADRLRERGVADRVSVATYDGDPTELDPDTEGTVYVVPMAPAPDRDTTRAIPGAIPDAHHCEPVGTSPAIVRGLADRARETLSPGPDVSLGLVAFGGGPDSSSWRTTEQQADRLRETVAYGDVTTAYLLENPAVECLRYNLPGKHAVVVPFFLAPCEETDHAIPGKLELDRGGLVYADPLGTHEAVTDAIEAEFAKARAIGSGTAAIRPIATDGRGH
jgi:sirohydrochlorin ferrochelatase